MIFFKSPFLINLKNSVATHVMFQTNDMNHISQYIILNKDMLKTYSYNNTSTLGVYLPYAPLPDAS